MNKLLTIVSKKNNIFLVIDYFEKNNVKCSLDSTSPSMKNNSLTKSANLKKSRSKLELKKTNSENTIPKNESDFLLGNGIVNEQTIDFFNEDINNKKNINTFKMNRQFSEKYFISPQMLGNKRTFFNKKNNLMDSFKLVDSKMNSLKKKNLKNTKISMYPALMGDQKKLMIFLKNNSLHLDKNPKQENGINGYKMEKIPIKNSTNYNNMSNSKTPLNNFGLQIKQIISHKTNSNDVAVNKEHNSIINNHTNHTDIIQEKIQEDNKQTQPTNQKKSDIIQTENVNLKNLSNREKSYYLLSQSTVLRLTERIIFSQSTKKIRDLIPIKDILISNELFIRSQINILNEKLESYTKMIMEPFVPSKLAEISLNFITTEDEKEFIHLFLLKKLNDNKEGKDFYYNYINIMNYLIENKFIETDKKENVANLLYQTLNNKGYKHFKDFLYEMFISKKNKNNNLTALFDNFEELKETLPNKIENNAIIKLNRFISFSYFLIKEFLDYGIKKKEIIFLKEETEQFLNTLKCKIKRFELDK